MDDPSGLLYLVSSILIRQNGHYCIYTASLATRKYGGSQMLINSVISCTGSEENLADCIIAGVGSGIAYGNCKSETTAGVICSASE